MFELIAVVVVGTVVVGVLDRLRRRRRKDPSDDTSLPMLARAYRSTRDPILGIWTASVPLRYPPVRIQKPDGEPTTIWVPLGPRVRTETPVPEHESLHIELLPGGATFVDTRRVLEHGTLTPAEYRAIVEGAVALATRIEADSLEARASDEESSRRLSPEQSKALAARVARERAELEARQKRLLERTSRASEGEHDNEATHRAPALEAPQDPLAFLPPGDAAAQFSEETVNAHDGATVEVRLAAHALVVVTRTKGATETASVSLEQPFRVFLSTSHDQKGRALLHANVRQQDGDWVQIGLSSRTDGFPSPVDGLPNMRTRFPMISETSMQKLLAALREAMAWHGPERWH